MKIMKTILLALSATLVLISCRTLSCPDDFISVTKKTSQDEFKAKFESKIVGTPTVEIKDESYHLYCFKMLTFEETYTSTSTNSFPTMGGYGSNSHTHTRSATFDDYYIFIFNDSKLLTSGFIYELMRNQDETIKKVGIAAYDQFIQKD